MSLHKKLCFLQFIQRCVYRMPYCKSNPGIMQNKSIQVEPLNMVSLEGVGIRRFRGYSDFFKGACFTRSRAYHSQLWCSPLPRHTSTPLRFPLLLAQIEFFWSPHLTKIDTGKPERPASEGPLRNLTSSTSLLPPHSVFQTTRCPSNLLLLPQLLLIIISLSFMC